MNKYMFLLCTTSLFLASCSTAPKVTVLPENGPTTAQLYHGSYTSSSAKQSHDPRAFKGLEVIQPNYSESSITSTHVEEINQDFTRLPNPQIVGYVYPHFGASDMPIPGYFTAFYLYDKDEIILSK